MTLLIILLCLGYLYFKYFHKSVMRHYRKTHTPTRSHSSSVSRSSTSSPRRHSPMSQSRQNLRQITFDELLEAVSKRGFIAFDFETTGLSAEREHIIEIGAVYFNPRCEEAARFSTYVRPPKHIPASATQINHITDSMVASAPVIDEALPSFLNFLVRWNAPLVAYNASFDIAFLQAALSKQHIELNADYADAYAYAKLHFKNLNSYKLQSVCNHIDYSNPAPHCAVEDAAAVAAIVRHAYAPYR